ncbi:MAG: phosphatase PAP2 family protein [Myxococcales bacterium]|nr:phosphatase PAP2 family protein [Myxococcales bacterium]
MSLLQRDYPAVSTSVRLYATVVLVWLMVVIPVWWTGSVYVHPRLLWALGWQPAFAAVAATWMLALHRLGEQGMRPWMARLTYFVGMVCLAFAALRLVPMLGLLGSAVLTPYAWPEADAWLAAPEQWIGLTHRVAWEWAERMGLHDTLHVVYHAMRWQVLSAFLYWAFVGRDLRPIWELVALIAFTFAVGCGIYVLVPASGPYVFYGYGPQVPPPSFLSDYYAMRTGQPFLLVRPDGYIAFPSFHTIWAIFTTWVWRKTPLVWVAAVWNVAVLVATFITGWHYLADMVAGGVFAAVTIAWLCPPAEASATTPSA